MQGFCWRDLGVSGLSVDTALGLHKHLRSESPLIDVERLLCYVLDCAPSYLRTWPEKALSPAQVSSLIALLERRESGEPVAYLTGKQGFWSLELEVDASTLIPRPDTECLVEYILALDLPSSARVLDLGTGTGAIALALAAERPIWKVVGTDLSAGAIALAKRNADNNDLSGLRFYQGSWFAGLPEAEQFDLIVSNPPYVSPTDKHLEQGDVRFEPLSALVAEKEGMSDIIEIVEQAEHYLLARGWLVLEHGYNQGEAVRNVLSDNGFVNVNTFKDYGLNERFSVGQRLS